MNQKPPSNQTTSTAGATESSSSSGAGAAGDGATASSKAPPLGMWAFIKLHGFPMYLYYWITNEIIVLCLTYLIHYQYIPGSDIIDWLKWLGAGKLVDLDKTMDKSVKAYGVEVSARFLTNFSLASAIMTLFTPIQIPLCLATYPYLRNAIRRVRGKPPIGAAFTPAATTTSSVANAKR